MSSYKRIPKSLVKKSDDSVTIAAKYAGKAEGYYQYVEQHELQKVKEKVQNTEQEMLEELTQQRNAWVEQAYQEGFEKAKEEVTQEITQQHQQLLNEANDTYEKANHYYQTILQETEQVKQASLQQHQEQILQLIITCSEKLLRQTIEEKPEVVATMFQSVLEEITYENKKVFLRVHPKTREWLLGSEYGFDDVRLELLPDSTLDPADLVVETERECLDATIESQLDTLKNVLRSAIHDEF